MVKKIRWYGLPRSTTNNLSVNAGNGDVTPLRDVLTSIAAGSQALNIDPNTGKPVLVIPQAPFEVQLPLLVNGANPPLPSADYAQTTTSGPTQTAMGTGAQYICAWGPLATPYAVLDPKPKMIRITMTIDDPGGRLGDGQTYEYIYTLP
jgi:hypothetical protein